MNKWKEHDRRGGKEYNRMKIENILKEKIENITG
jgi:hypothetical protein